VSISGSDNRSFNMANMAYCRFRNTLNDLLECEEHLSSTDLSKEENAARDELLRACRRILNDYGDLINDSEEEDDIDEDDETN